MIEPVKIEGLTQLQAALRAVDGEAQKQLRLVFKDAAEMIVKGATTKIPRLSGVAQAKGVKAKAEQRGASIVRGGAKVPYMNWLDHGGKVGPGKSVERRFSREGRYLFPSVGANREEMLDMIARGLTAAMDAAGLEAKETST